MWKTILVLFFSVHLGHSIHIECNADSGINEERLRAGIDRFCSEAVKTPFSIVPPISFGSGKTIEGGNRAVGLFQQIEDQPNLPLWLSVTFDSGKSGAFNFPAGDKNDHKDNCLKQYTSILDKCTSSDTNMVHGGTSSGSKDIYKIDLSFENPLRAYWGDLDDLGDLVCVESDVASCDCHYAKLPDSVAKFLQGVFGCPERTYQSTLLGDVSQESVALLAVNMSTSAGLLSILS